MLKKNSGMPVVKSSLTADKNKKNTHNNQIWTTFLTWLNYVQILQNDTIRAVSVLVETKKILHIGHKL